MDALLKAVRNYLDITYEDADTDQKLTGIIERGKVYLDDIAGTKQNYEQEGEARALLFNYCRYARNNVMELFSINFQAELIALRMGVQADEYAKRQGYV